MSGAITRHTGRFTLEDRAASSWHYLPVELGTDAAGLDVRLSYERIGATLDLGCLAPDGWRGWSGGARDRFVITPTAATPGYRAGALEPGVWHVVLGLHRVPVPGVGYELTVTTGPAQPAPEVATMPVPERRPRRELPALDGRRWLAGDFHAHSTHSDGAHTLPNVAVIAAAQGLDFIAVTDHNTTSHHEHLAAAGRHAGIVLVPGQEVTTDLGHANAFGDIGWIDFREETAEWLRTTTERGGLLSVNHPVSGDCAWRRPGPRRSPVAEIWHGSWRDRTDGGALAWWAAHGWAQTPIGGSDWHGLAANAVPGSPTTWVACDGDDILGGVAAGRTAVSIDRNGPVLLRVGDEFVVDGADGALLRGPDGARRIVRGDRAVFPAAPGPHLLEDPDRAVLALCN